MRYMSNVSVLVADDDSDARALIEKYVKGEPALSLVGSAADAQQAIDLAVKHRPDAAIIDVAMPAGGGVRAVREISELSPDTSLIALSGYDDRNTVLEMLEAGATAYLVKGATREQILHTVRHAIDAHDRLTRLDAR
jgi:DNA-binding NarL/FixJ family response regulator